MQSKKPKCHYVSASTQDVPSILLLDSSGSRIVSPANRLYGDGFKFKCAAPNIEDEQFAFTMELESLSDDGSWTSEVMAC